MTVEEYIERLKEMYHIDGTVQKNATSVFKEMVLIAKTLLISNKAQIEKRLTFVTREYNRVTNILNNLEEVESKTQLQNKYDVFINARNLLVEDTPDELYDHLSNINLSVSNIVRKIRNLRRRKAEMLYTITNYYELITYYETSYDDLEDFENQLSQ